MPDAANPFESMADSTDGAPSLSASEIAAQAAAEAVRGPSLSRPGTKFQEYGTQEPLESDEMRYMEFEEQPEPTYEDEPLDYDEEPASEPTYSREDLQRFAELLPISPDEVPPGAEGLYADMAQALIDHQQRASAAILEGQEAVMRLQKFAEQFSTPEGQQRLLMTMALNNPDTFDKVFGEVQRMQEDPRYADVVRRDIEAQIKLEAAERRETAMRQAQLRQKATQIEGRAERLAKRLGIDADWAKEQVAQRIIMNHQRTGNRDITFAEVDEVITGLAKRVGKPSRAKAPQQRAREATAPTQPAQAASRDAPPRTARAPQPASNVGDHWTSSLKGAVRTAADRARKSGF